MVEARGFEEKRAKGAQVLPSSVRLVKFEKAAPQLEEAGNEADDNEQGQDVKAVGV